MFEEDTNSLMHYGVMGMRWGIRRGNSSTVYAKAGKKMKRLSSNMDKKETKRLKRTAHQHTSIGVGYARKATRKADIAKGKAVKWYKKMNKVLGETKASEILNSTASESGRAYVEQALKWKKF